MLLKTKQLAYLGVLLAMNQIVLLLSMVFPANTLVIYALAALMIGVVIVETNLKGGISFYIASSLLAFILAGDKIQILTYIGFFGFYSIAKYVIENFTHKKHVSMAIELLIKGILFNILLVIYYVAMRAIVPIPNVWWIIPLAQIFFFAYDYCFGYFMVVYMRKIKPYFKWNR
ncbi:hypothetical protein HZI73_00330 [Vallitalea pronyensis]|uniref:Uncharacterized protein n=1 Tax=Vallitalea pronyensis TaxID=1348613 RepID=A0A8J8SEX9_9FIRM|nr:hypothetical protein [Vallitalea pronyensis]QUI20847.1 hypothetical protein HZI73_00330 [Vallitalea pronyensis]